MGRSSRCSGSYAPTAGSAARGRPSKTSGPRARRLHRRRSRSPGRVRRAPTAARSSSTRSASSTRAAAAAAARARARAGASRVGAADYAPVDVRVVAATNRKLASDVAAGRFRADLFYRLTRAARAAAAVARAARGHSAARRALPRRGWRRRRRSDAGAQALLVAHDWPGNVRELRNVVRRAAVAPARRESDHAGASRHRRSDRDARALSRGQTGARRRLGDRLSAAPARAHRRQHERAPRASPGSSAPICIGS